MKPIIKRVKRKNVKRIEDQMKMKAIGGRVWGNAPLQIFAIKEMVPGGINGVAIKPEMRPTATNSLNMKEPKNPYTVDEVREEKRRNRRSRPVQRIPQAINMPVRKYPSKSSAAMDSKQFLIRSQTSTNISTATKPSLIKNLYGVVAT